MNSVTNIYITDDVSVITIDNMPADIGAMAELFCNLSSADVNVDMISQSAAQSGCVAVSFTVSDSDFAKSMAVMGDIQLQYDKLNVRVNAGNIKLSVYGEPMRETPGVAAKLFSALKQAGVNIKQVSTSETDISVLIEAKDGDGAVDAVNAAFEL